MSTGNSGPKESSGSSAPRPAASTGRGFGIDIGGSGIKGATVDLVRGELLVERLRLETPHPATPPAVAKTVGKVVDHFGWTGEVGVTFPAVIKNGVAHTAANVDKSWIGTDVSAVLRTAGPVTVLNDADAAGVAEVRYGAGREVGGVVIVVTLGTGIGSALFVDGRLVPNTEFGHLEIDGHDAETRAADSAREREDLTWEKWAHRVQKYLRHLEALIWPDLIVVGGGVSKKSAKWLPYVDVRSPVRPAELLNNAGIVGAALLAAETSTSRPAGATETSTSRPAATTPAR